MSIIVTGQVPPDHEDIEQHNYLFYCSNCRLWEDGEHGEEKKKAITNNTNARRRKREDKTQSSSKHLKVSTKDGSGPNTDNTSLPSQTEKGNLEKPPSKRPRQDEEVTEETSVERIATSDASPALRTVAQFSRQISAHQVKENKQRKERQQNVPSLEDFHQVKINKNNIRDPDTNLVLKEKKKVEEIVPGAGETSAHKDDDGRKKHRKLSDVGDETRTTKMNVRWIPETPNNTRILDLVEHIGQCQETECSCEIS